MSTLSNQAIQTATDVLTKCAANDPWFPHPTEAMILAWAEQIARTSLSREDLLAGVTECYATRGDGFKPLPADVIGAARAVRRERVERRPPPEWEAHDDQVAARLAPRILALGQAWSVPDDTPSSLRVKRSAAQFPTGPDRCDNCGHHIETQGHRDGCAVPQRSTPNPERNPAA